MGDGYGVADPIAPVDGIVIAAALGKTLAAAGPAVKTTNPVATMSEDNTPAMLVRLALAPWRMCVILPLDKLL